MRSSDILIVDDEIGIRDLLSDILQDEGYTVALAENAEEARQLRNQTRPTMVLLDIWMPDCDGITLLKEWAKNGQLNMPVVMMSGHASIDTAVEATKIGAMDFLEKPIALKKLLATVERALKYGEMQVIVGGRQFDKLGNSAVIQELNRRLETATRHNGSILLTGETGAPFETVARYFHKHGTPWIEPNKTEYIVDMPSELLQRASGGILYLGDITKYSKNIQQGISFLLSQTSKHNVRIICASSLELAQLREHSNSDPKLIATLSTTTIHLPALREQAEDDIAFLINKAATELAEAQKNPVVHFSAGAITLLQQYDWPGNHDQLKTVVRNLTLTCENNEVSEAAVSSMLAQFGASTASGNPGGLNFNMPLRELREELERRYFEYHIAQENQNMSRVAQKVGLERTHLYRKLKQLGIQFSRRNKTEDNDGSEE